MLLDTETQWWPGNAIQHEGAPKCSSQIQCQDIAESRVEGKASSMQLLLPGWSNML